MHREFAGLKGMPYYDQMLKAVLEAHSSPLVEPPSSQVTRAMDAYSVNEPQAKAILGAMNPNTSGFVLIQGYVQIDRLRSVLVRFPSSSTSVIVP